MAGKAEPPDRKRQRRVPGGRGVFAVGNTMRPRTGGRAKAAATFIKKERLSDEDEDEEEPPLGLQGFTKKVSCLQALEYMSDPRWFSPLRARRHAAKNTFSFSPKDHEEAQALAIANWASASVPGDDGAVLEPPDELLEGIEKEWTEYRPLFEAQDDVMASFSVDGEAPSSCTQPGRGSKERCKNDELVASYKKVLTGGGQLPNKLGPFVTAIYRFKKGDKSAEWTFAWGVDGKKSDADKRLPLFAAALQEHFKSFMTESMTQKQRKNHYFVLTEDVLSMVPRARSAWLEHVLRVATNDDIQVLRSTPGASAKGKTSAPGKMAGQFARILAQFAKKFSTTVRVLSPYQFVLPIKFSVSLATVFDKWLPEAPDWMEQSPDLYPTNIQGMIADLEVAQSTAAEHADERGSQHELARIQAATIYYQNIEKDALALHNSHPWEGKDQGLELSITDNIMGGEARDDGQVNEVLTRGITPWRMLGVYFDLGRYFASRPQDDILVRLVKQLIRMPQIIAKTLDEEDFDEERRQAGLQQPNKRDMPRDGTVQGSEQALQQLDDEITLLRALMTIALRSSKSRQSKRVKKILAEHFPGLSWSRDSPQVAVTYLGDTKESAGEDYVTQKYMYADCAMALASMPNSPATCALTTRRNEFVTSKGVRTNTSTMGATHALHKLTNGAMPRFWMDVYMLIIEIKMTGMQEDSRGTARFCYAYTKSIKGIPWGVSDAHRRMMQVFFGQVCEEADGGKPEDVDGVFMPPLIAKALNESITAKTEEDKMLAFGIRLARIIEAGGDLRVDCPLPNETASLQATAARATIVEDGEATDESNITTDDSSGEDESENELDVAAVSATPAKPRARGTRAKPVDASADKELEEMLDEYADYSMEQLRAQAVKAGAGESELRDAMCQGDDDASRKALLWLVLLEERRGQHAQSALADHVEGHERPDHAHDGAELAGPATKKQRGGPNVVEDDGVGVSAPIRNTNASKAEVLAKVHSDHPVPEWLNNHSNKGTIIAMVTYALKNEKDFSLSNTQRDNVAQSCAMNDSEMDKTTKWLKARFVAEREATARWEAPQADAGDVAESCAPCPDQRGAALRIKYDDVCDEANCDESSKAGQNFCKMACAIQFAKDERAPGSNCAMPRCPKECYRNPFTGAVHTHCDARHAARNKKYKRHCEQLGGENQFMMLESPDKDSGLCSMPGCGQEVKGEYCGISHRLIHIVLKDAKAARGLNPRAVLTASLDLADMGVPRQVELSESEKTAAVLAARARDTTAAQAALQSAEQAERAAKEKSWVQNAERKTAQRLEAHGADWTTSDHYHNGVLCIGKGNMSTPNAGSCPCCATVRQSWAGWCDLCEPDRENGIPGTHLQPTLAPEQGVLGHLQLAAKRKGLHDSLNAAQRQLDRDDAKAKAEAKAAKLAAAHAKVDADIAAEEADERQQTLLSEQEWGRANTAARAIATAGSKAATRQAPPPSSGKKAAASPRLPKGAAAKKKGTITQHFKSPQKDGETGAAPQAAAAAPASTGVKASKRKPDSAEAPFAFGDHQFGGGPQGATATSHEKARKKHAAAQEQQHAQSQTATATAAAATAAAAVLKSAAAEQASAWQEQLAAQKRAFDSDRLRLEEQNAAAKAELMREREAWEAKQQARDDAAATATTTAAALAASLKEKADEEMRQLHRQLLEAKGAASPGPEMIAALGDTLRSEMKAGFKGINLSTGKGMSHTTPSDRTRLEERHAIWPAQSVINCKDRWLNTLAGLVPGEKVSKAHKQERGAYEWQNSWDIEYNPTRGLHSEKSGALPASMQPLQKMCQQLHHMRRGQYTGSDDNTEGELIAMKSLIEHLAQGWVPHGIKSIVNSSNNSTLATIMHAVQTHLRIAHVSDVDMQGALNRALATHKMHVCLWDKEEVAVLACSIADESYELLKKSAGLKSEGTENKDSLHTLSAALMASSQTATGTTSGTILDGNFDGVPKYCKVSPEQAQALTSMQNQGDRPEVLNLVAKAATTMAPEDVLAATDALSNTDDTTSRTILTGHFPRSMSTKNPGISEVCSLKKALVQKAHRVIDDLKLEKDDKLVITLAYAQFGYCPLFMFLPTTLGSTRVTSDDQMDGRQIQTALKYMGKTMTAMGWEELQPLEQITDVVERLESMQVLFQAAHDTLKDKSALSNFTKLSLSIYTQWAGCVRTFTTREGRLGRDFPTIGIVIQLVGTVAKPSFMQVAHLLQVEMERMLQLHKYKGIQDGPKPKGPWDPEKPSKAEKKAAKAAEAAATEEECGPCVEEDTKEKKRHGVLTTDGGTTVTKRMVYGFTEERKRTPVAGKEYYCYFDWVRWDKGGCCDAKCKLIHVGKGKNTSPGHNPEALSRYKDRLEKEAAEYYDGGGSIHKDTVIKMPSSKGQINPRSKGEAKVKFAPKSGKDGKPASSKNKAGTKGK